MLETVEQRAEFARALEYIKEDAVESAIDDRLDQIQDVKETRENYMEACDIADKMPPTDDTKDEEVERLLNANTDVSFDQMIGIVDSDNPSKSTPVGKPLIDEKNEHIQVAARSVGGPGETIPGSQEKAGPGQILTKDKVKEMAEQARAAKEAVTEEAEEETSLTEEYIDALESTADRLVQMAPAWDQPDSHDYMMSRLSISRVDKEENQTTLVMESFDDFFDGKTISAVIDDTTGKVNVTLV